MRWKNINLVWLLADCNIFNMKFNTICDLWFLWFLNRFENSLDNIKIHNYILLSYFGVKKYQSGLILADCNIFNMKFNIICDLWFLWFLNRFENSLDNIKIHNYILLSYFGVKKYQSGLIFSRLYIFNMKFNTICDLWFLWFLNSLKTV